MIIAPCTDVNTPYEILKMYKAPVACTVYLIFDSSYKTKGKSEQNKLIFSLFFDMTGFVTGKLMMKWESIHFLSVMHCCT